MVVKKSLSMGKVTKNFNKKTNLKKFQNFKSVKISVNEENGNPQLANALAKVIQMSMKEEDIKPQFDENIKPIDTDINKKQKKLQRGRLKPSALDREKERPLVKIATKGVVQLFNAVRQHQSTLNKEISKPGLTESKKEKILKSVDKKAFLDVLSGKNKKVNDTISNFDMTPNLEDVKTEPEYEQPSWEVLRDDFMMSAKLKDWDKKEINIAK